ncbi:PPP4R2-domain-containing protein [Hygrophoropsis aurantiaca]|uniref:PPP4R2-domain-containing protein n=1 Tax=Hygrophoropsis aurantiaca TaxID=72124 RepID=A0ACB8ARG1_9AGAM|nr:PPP4R2-domain-containing protein [Hygrophoropsis aurantiaca]
MSSISIDFQWLPDYDAVLDQIAATDVVQPNTDWNQLREMVKYKIEKNITLFLAVAPEAKNAEESWQTYPPGALAGGGLRLPPFPPRKRNEHNPTEPPKVHMNQDEANEMKEFIFKQLHEFEDDPPFTIQRVCELCVRPREHYKALGKYLRAMEKALLVTSTWNAFPPENSPTSARPNISSISSTSSATRSAPTTPIFSPISFLHDDARRSRSHSPPPSPLALSGMDPSGVVEALGDSATKAIGLVDELDDPSPGHMSDHPTALTAVTTVGSRPFLESLDQRFIKAEDQQQQTSENNHGVAMDATHDKENQGQQS